MKYQTGKTNLLFVAVAFFAIAIGIYVQSGGKLKQQPPELVKGILLPTTKPLGKMNFTDHTGKPFGLTQLKDKWSILFFGFTNCPDVCPTTMQTMKQVKQTVAEAGLWSRFQVVMVSVDPERDSTDRLSKYVPYFDPEFIGISADVEHTTAFAKNLGILFFKDKPEENGGYDVEHGVALILVNPMGQFAGVFSGPHKVDEISQDLITLADSAYQSVATPSDAKQPRPSLVGEKTTLPELSFSDAWIRPAPPGVANMSAYFTLINNSQQDIVITSAESPAFRTVMIHETVVEDDVASMQHLQDLTIPSGKSVLLEPLGKHMMLMGAKTPLAEGDRAEVTITDQNGVAYSVEITVKQGS